MGQNKIGIIFGLAAALLFGAAAPMAKSLLSSTPPLMLAALLYCGSGLGLFFVALFRRLTAPDKNQVNTIKRSEIGWLSFAILSGGILAPIAMMQGLSLSGAASGSMLLNLEGVFTTALAWLVFKENVDRRIFAGMVAILLGGFVLSFGGDIGGMSHSTVSGSSAGSLFIALACLLWALDNNLCRKVSTSDSVLVAMLKGLTAGSVNLAISFACGLTAPALVVWAPALLIGFVSYGLGLVLYLRAQRYLGTARTGAYFAFGPFAGAIFSLVFLHEPLGLNLVIAAALMLFGLWLHLTERHSHAHVHEAIEHSHEHSHGSDDPHHEHEHEPGVDTTKPHTHVHKHDRLLHSHEHYPDSHHEHTHRH